MAGEGERQPLLTPLETSGASASKILQGSVLILISNVIYIGNNYLVAWTRINASEIALVRGGFQVIVFGIIVWRSRRTNESGNTTYRFNFNSFETKPNEHEICFFR